MRQNNKIFRAGPAIGEQLDNLVPFDASNPPVSLNSSLMMSQEPSKSSDGGLGDVVAEDDKAADPNETVRDMTLLANAVIRRGGAKVDDLGSQAVRDIFAADPNDSKDSAFSPIRMEMPTEDGALVVDTIERAIECLTTLWPVRHGQAYEDALQSCIDGMKGRASPQQVRSSVIAAANEAGIRIIT
ncbi:MULTISPECIES: DUF982 domain-containing protein [Rhizobium]|uniref:DUF982 domain-containing protein n=1 Tax=Rhizobium TaxID=379 RepID=UPI001959E19B|nr:MULTISPECIES: DUF982 domain-containing protein [Rhizobium]MBM7047473.1 DUF982 domain-containing protein [Rhizobium lusitanum]